MLFQKDIIDSYLKKNSSMFDVRTDQWFFFRHLSIYIFLAVPPKKSPKNTTPQGGDGQILAVYDLGGGTFDISILEISGGVAWPWWTRWWTTWKGRGTPKKPVKKAVNSQPFLIFWEFYGFISFFFGLFWGWDVPIYSTGCSTFPEMI